jgi:hypothetical protein
LGSDGLEVSELGLGCFDTAEAYGPYAKRSEGDRYPEHLQKRLGR